MLVVPLDDGQQVFAVLQGQLTDIGQALLRVLHRLQDQPPVAGHRRLLQLQGGVQAGIPQVWHWTWRDDHCKHTDFA